MSDSSLQSTLREMRRLFTSVRTLGVLAALVVVFALSGPFNTLETMTPGGRFAYWGTTTFLTFGVGMFCGSWAIEVARRRQWPPAARTLIAGLAAGLPVSAVVLTIDFLANGQFRFAPGFALTITFYCVTIAMVITLLYALFRRTEPTAGTEPVQPPKLLERVPLPQRGKLISLSQQDHYVEVTTSKGRTLVLMRLSDAIAETGGLAGLQIHRSHWVALDAIASVKRVEGRVLIETHAGSRLPVSRSYLDAVRQAGLIV